MMTVLEAAGYWYAIRLKANAVLERQIAHLLKWTWTLTTLREKLTKIGAKVVHHAKAVTFQLAEVTVPREMFAAILRRIGRLRAAPNPG